MSKNITIISYYWITEYFTTHGDNIILDKYTNIVYSKSKNTQTVYGNITINDESIIRAKTLSIGIDSSNKAHCNGDFSCPSKINAYYSYFVDGYIYHHCDDDSEYDGIESKIIC